MNYVFSQIQLDVTANILLYLLLYAIQTYFGGGVFLFLQKMLTYVATPF